MSKNYQLIEILNILKGELYKFNEINNEIVEQQNLFEKIENNYNQYYNLMEEGNNNVNDITNKGYHETLFIYFSFFFFFGCVFYVLSKRIPIRKIIMYIFELISKIAHFNKNNDL